MNDWRNFLFGLSIGLNVAFLAVWGFFVLEDLFEPRRARKPHRRPEEVHGRDHGGRELARKFYFKKIDVSDSQWKRIEPRLKNFHREAYELCREIGRKRNRLLELVNEAAPDTEINRVREEIIGLRKSKQDKAIKYFEDKKKYLSAKQSERFFRLLSKKPRCRKHAAFLESAGPSRGW